MILKCFLEVAGDDGSCGSGVPARDSAYETASTIAESGQMRVLVTHGPILDLMPLNHALAKRSSFKMAHFDPLNRCMQQS